MKEPTSTAPAAAETPAAEGAPAAGFEDLAQEAGALEGGPPIPGTQAAADSQAQQHEATTRELMQALVMARMLVQPMFGWWQEFPRVWGDETLKGIALNGAAVMVRNGWTMGEFFEKWGPYLALAMATVPPCAVTWQAIKAHKQAAEKANTPGAQPTTEGAKNGSDGKAPD